MRDVTSIIQSFSTIVLMGIVLLIVVVGVVGCLFLSFSAIEFAQIINTPMPY